MDPKDIIRRAWENREARWPAGADRFYVSAFQPIVSVSKPTEPEDWSRPVPREEYVVEFRREVSVDRCRGYRAGRVVGTFKGEELTLDQWLMPLSEAEQ